MMVACKSEPGWVTPEISSSGASRLRWADGREDVLCHRKIAFLKSYMGRGVCLLFLADTDDGSNAREPE